MTWRGWLMAIPIAVALLTAAMMVRSAPATLLVALPIAGFVGALLGACALAGAQLRLLLPERSTRAVGCGGSCSRSAWEPPSFS
ncbi:hypothetical protein FCG67_18485 [Rhodococcus oryzae]|uniref:Uncharacterized protein n=1 Tax=Rhodococcus oryzae TaxID=2571143 RepID=A0ABY2RGF0_9NOCA|nr:hypothetical protein [Rhodococcus oryzae]TJZ76007.1 hypothetical protein FCG67_18485 [Rhodococcus oryzae]